MAGKSLVKKSITPTPKNSDSLYVPLDAAGAYPKVYRPLMVPNTFFRVDKKNGAITALVTVMPSETHVAWDVCSGCHEFFRICKCARGITTPRDIEYIYDATVAMLAGEEWSMNHPNYRGSLRQAERAKMNAGPRLTAPITSIGAAPTSSRKPVVATPVPKPLTKPPAGRTGPQKPLLRKSSPAPAPLPAEATDLGRLNKAAASAADDITAQFTKRLLKKNPEPEPPKKRILRKRP